MAPKLKSSPHLNLSMLDGEVPSRMGTGRNGETNLTKGLDKTDPSFSFQRAGVEVFKQPVRNVHSASC